MRGLIKSESGGLMPLVERDQVEKTIFAAIDNVNRLLLPAQRLVKSGETLLTGNDSALDSLGLVNLIVAVERGVEEKFGASITLVSQESMSLKDSPFHSVEALVDYTQSLLEKKMNGAFS